MKRRTTRRERVKIFRVAYIAKKTSTRSVSQYAITNSVIRIRLELVPARDVREEPPREDRGDGEEQKSRRDVQLLLQARHLRRVRLAPAAARRAAARSIFTAAIAAPKPLSMFTATTPVAQLFSAAARGLRPPIAAP